MKQSLFILGVAFLLCIFTLVTLTYDKFDVQAKSQNPTATCTLWDSSLPFPLHLCVDQNGLTCIKSDSGMFQCNLKN